MIGRTAIVADGRAYSYDELDEASKCVAGTLLGDNDDLNQTRVAFLVAPGFPYAAIQRGIWRAGGVAVPLAVSHPPAELEYVVRDADASVGATPASSDHSEVAVNSYDTAARAVSLAEQSMKAAHDEARYAEWIERIRNASRATSLLVQRPSPDAYRLGYPTAMEAYREVSRLVEKL